MWTKIAIQNTDKWIGKHSHKDQEYVYLVENFEEKHSFVNIYKSMILDIFYQLLKRVVDGTHILQSLKTIIRAKLKEAGVQVGTIKLL